MFLIPLLFIILIFWLIFIVISNSNHPYYRDNSYHNNGYSLDRSLEILRERYARGEISTEEYQKIKKNLEN